MGKKKIKDLRPKDAKTVVGGRKAGEGQKEYLVVKLNEVLITGVSPSGSGGDGG